MGYLGGYTDGAEDVRNALVSHTEVKTADLVTLTQAPVSIAPTQAVVRVLVPKINWGGPELWQEVNKKRQEYGVNPLTKADELCTIASIRLNELMELGSLDNHEGFSNMTERRLDLKWIFEKYSVVAEFLAMGGETPQETVSLWNNTLGHKKLLDGGEYVWGCIYAQNTFAVAITAY